MKKILSTLLISFLLFAGCKESKDEPNPIPADKKNVKQVTLVYAVNYGNGLASALTLNENQMIDALGKIDNGEDVIYLFKTYKNSNGDIVSGLFKAVQGSDAEFILEKEYDRNLLPTDPKRMKDIIDEVLKEKGDIYNLFLWGHGMSWTPYFSDHTATRSISVESMEINQGDFPEVAAFGGDNSRDWMDIDELKEAIPDQTFETIWFDCCYMSNIETVYELRNKCKWMVAYPTEIASDGLPYDEVLPYVLKDEKDLVGAAQALYDHYDARRIAVTVAVMDMSKIAGVADACHAVYTFGDKRPEAYGLQNYSRSSGNPYYDFGQYVREYAQANDSESLLKKFESAMDEFVIYSVASDRDFNGKAIIKDNYSGVSTHLFKDSQTKKDDYYKTIDWYKATYVAE